MNDLKLALRQLLKSPGFTAVTVLTLALGIGANAGIFSLLYAIVWRALPVKNPAGLFNLHQGFAGKNSRYIHYGLYRLSYPEYLNYRDRGTSVADLTASEETTLTLGGAEASGLNAVFAAGNYFSMLAATTELGRTWSAAECEKPGACPFAVLSYGFWQRHYGGDREVLGRTIILNRQPITVLGVSAPEFRGVDISVPDLWVPLLMREQLVAEPGQLAARDFSWLRVIGRLKPGVTLTLAREAFSRIAAQSDLDAAITSQPERKSNVQIKPAAFFNSPEELGRGLPIAAVVMSMVGLILLAVCANVSNLFLARASARRREIGVRLALGASRGRLVWQLLTESLLLAVMAGFAALAVVMSLPRLWIAWIPGPPINLSFTPNPAIFGYCATVSILAGIAFGLAPALQSTRLDVTSMLATQAPLLGRRIAGARLRHVLLVTQVATSFVLLIAAGLLIRGLQRALDVDLGLQRTNILALAPDTKASRYSAVQTSAYYSQLAERFGQLPGVKSVALAAVLPFSGSRMELVAPRLSTEADPTPRITVNVNFVSPNYFETLGIALLRGRRFTETEAQQHLPLAVINQSMADRLWPGDDPIGRRFSNGGPQPYEVIGVVRNVSSISLGQMDGPFYYRAANPGGDDGLSLVLHSAPGKQNLQKPLHDLATALDPAVAFSIRSLEDNIEQAMRPAKLAALLTGGLGLVAIGLVAVGLYGVMAYVVSQRVREIGVRIALGAPPARVQREFVSEAAGVLSLGVGIGLMLAIASSHVLVRVLFGLSPMDPTTFTGVAALLVTIALTACWLPARRASRVDPMVALRTE
jgi:predicted permease